MSDENRPDSAVVVPSRYPGNVVTEAEVLQAISGHEVLQQGVDAFMARSDSPAVFAMGAVLQLLSQCVHPDVYFPGNRQIGGQLFVLNVGPSGFARKSTPVYYVQDALKEAGLGERCPPEPGSEELLTDQVVERPHHIMTYPEFGKFLGQASDGYRQTIKMAFNDLADGAGMGRPTVSKKTKTPNKKVRVEKTRVSIYGAVTPDYLEEWTVRSDFTAGLYGRCLMLWAVRERELKDANLDDPRTKTRWDAFVAKIRELAFNSFAPPTGDPAAPATAVGPMLDLSSGELPGSEPQNIPKIARCLGFDATATNSWHLWIEGIKTIQRADADTATLFARLEQHTQRVAFLLAWCRAPRDGALWYIGYQDMLIARFFIERCVVPAYRVVWDQLAPSEYARLRRKLLNNIGSIPGDSARLGDLMYFVKAKQRDVEEALNGLCTEGFLRRSGDKRDSIYTRTTAIVNPERRDRLKLVGSIDERNADGTAGDRSDKPLLVVPDELGRSYMTTQGSASTAALVEAVDVGQNVPQLRLVPPLLEIPTDDDDDNGDDDA